MQSLQIDIAKPTDSTMIYFHLYMSKTFSLVFTHTKRTESVCGFEFLRFSSSFSIFRYAAASLSC